MSQALRDAIASVRRVTYHEVAEPPAPRVTPVRFEPRSLPPVPSDDDFLEDAETDERALLGGQESREELRYDQAAAAFDDRALYEDPPAADDQGYPEQPFEQPASADESPAPAYRADARAFDEDAPGEELRADESTDAPLPLGGQTRRDHPSLDVDAERLLPSGGDPADARFSLDDEHDETSPVLPQLPRSRAPVWRDSQERRRGHLAAWLLAPLLVLVAGFGLGILSGAQEFDRLLAPLGLANGDGLATPGEVLEPPTATSSAPSPTNGAAAPSTGSAPPAPGAAGPAPSPQLSELETVRVAPLPAPSRTEETPAQPVTDLPLPPPPKPEPWSSRSGGEASTSDRAENAADAATVLAADVAVADAIEDAADAVLAAGGAVADAPAPALEPDGAGGPFEPILVKTSSSEPRVFVHYNENAPGGRATAMHLIRHLRAAGYRVEGRAVAFPVSSPSIRYFFARDRNEAEAVSAELEGQVPGGAVSILDLTTYEPKPRQGHLEVWLAG